MKLLAQVQGNLAGCLAHDTVTGGEQQMLNTLL